MLRQLAVCLGMLCACTGSVSASDGGMPETGNADGTAADESIPPADAADSSDTGADATLDAPDAPEVDAGPPPFALVRMEPAMAPFGGGMATVYFQGEPPASVVCGTNRYCGLSLQVNGATMGLTCGGIPDVSNACPDHALTFNVPRSRTTVENLPISVVAYDGTGREIGRLDPAGYYLPPVNAMPGFMLWPAYTTSGPAGFDLPLAPELSEPCVRREFATLSNGGDLSFRVDSIALTGDAAFTVQQDDCTGRRLDYPGSTSNQCTVTLCFASDVPGTHTGTLTANTTTSAGPLAASVALSATVTSASTGLDPSFHTNGALRVPVYTETVWNPSNYPVRPAETPAALLGDGVVVASTAGLTRVFADGTSMDWTVSRVVAALASAPDHTSVYRVSDSGIDRWTDAGMDLSFGTGGTVSGGIGTMAGLLYLGAATTAPDGTLLVDDWDNWVWALTASGQPLSTFGSNGLVFFQPEMSIITDSQNRIYVGTSTCTSASSCTQAIQRRTLPTGGLDATFSYDHSGIFAVDAQDRLYVGSGAQVVRLDDVGVATPFTTGTPSGVSDMVHDMAFDAVGNLLVAFGSDRVLRYRPDGSFDAQVGLVGALRVLCPAQGGCWVVGRGSTSGDGYVARLAP